MNKEKNIQMLVSHLTGNCSNKEQLYVEKWINESSENMSVYNDLKKVWGFSEAKDIEPNFNVDNAWNNFRQKTNFDSVPQKEIKRANKSVFKKIAIYASSIAAASVLLFGLYFIFNNNNQPEILNYYSAVANGDNPYLLPDGTTLLMNKGSEVSYPEEFDSESRLLNFSGEAFFNVAHNPEHPMIISTGNVRVEILGTSFDLCNIPNTNEVTVFLETGKVLFYSIDNNTGEKQESIVVLPGEKAVYSKVTGEITKSEITNNNHLVWKTGILDFVATPMPEILKVISNAYRMNIETDIPIDHFILTARYENETPQSIMEAMSVIFGINYNIEGDNIHIY